MKGTKGWIVAVFLIWFAGGCQQSVSYQVSLAGASPDFPLIVIATLALFGDKRSGALVGFLGGVIHGAIAGAHLATYAVTRTLLGFAVGWFSSLEFEGNPVVAFIVVAAATLVTQIAFMLVTPGGAILPFLLATIGSAMYNGVLAVPLYALLNKVLDSPSR